jgi:hypothetical protein
MTYTGAVMAYEALSIDQMEIVCAQFGQCAISLEFEEGEPATRSLTLGGLVVAYVVTLAITQWATGFMLEHGRAAAVSFRKAIGSMLRHSSSKSEEHQESYLLLRNGDGAGQTFLIPASNVSLQAWQRLFEASSSRIPIVEVQLLTWDESSQA